MATTLEDINQHMATCFNSAKKWDGASLILRLLVFGGSIIAIYISVDFSWLPVIAFTFSLLVEGVSWYANSLKGKANVLKRTYEIADGLGYGPTRSEISNIKASFLHSKLVNVSNELLQGNIFSSKKEAGVHRLISNLMESSWWSRHLAKITAIYYLFLIIILLVTSFLTLFYSICSSTSHDEMMDTSKVVTTVILLIFSLGLINNCFGLYTFSRDASRIEETCDRELATPIMSEIEALRILHEYQLSRASSPLIPTWVWRKHRNKLNKLWSERTGE